MKNLGYLFTAIILISALASMPSCNNGCVDEVFLQTIKMDLQVNSENLGVPVSTPKNELDTIRSHQNQFYNYPNFRRFGIRHCPDPTGLFITSAMAQPGCPELTEYISRMDPVKTELRLNLDYDASALGLGVITAGTDLMSVNELRETYLQDVRTNAFLNGGAPAPLSLDKQFFQPINEQWVTFYFLFEEIDGTLFPDSVAAFIDLSL